MVDLSKLLENTNLYLNLTNAILVIVSSIIVSLLDPLLKSRLNKRKDVIWFDFLLFDKYVSDCLDKYKNIEYPTAYWTLIATFMGTFLGGFTYIIFIVISVLVFQTFIDIKSWSLAYPTMIISLLDFFLSIVIRKRIEDKKLLEKSEGIAVSIIFVNWFIFISFISVLLLTILRIYTSGVDINIIILPISIALLVGAILISLNNRRDFLNDIKHLLNKQYFNQDVETFPKIRIKTESVGIEGKVCDIFDDNLIILDNYGIKKAVEWDSITFMELKRYTQN